MNRSILSSLGVVAVSFVLVGIGYSTSLSPSEPSRSNSPIAIQLTRNLTLGSVGEDVRILQEFLNTDPRTIIASTGPGSRGNESTYFGPRTRDAVARFQEIYASDILSPSGLVRGTGYVGNATRTKINALRTSVYASLEFPTESVPASEFSSQAPAISGYEGHLGTLDAPIIAYLSDYEVSPGDPLTIYGGGYLAENALWFGDVYTIQGNSKNSTNISIRIPSDAPRGKYTLYVENSNGKTTFDVPIVIKDQGISSPQITRITPSSGKYGTMITLEGTGFTPQGNDVRVAGWNIFKDLPSSDGKTITLPITPYPELYDPEKNATTTPFSWTMHFLVVNANGVSSKDALTFRFYR